MIAEQHPDRRINDLGGDAVAILIGHARIGIPAAAMHVLELHAGDREFLGRLARRREQSHRDRTLHAVDHEHVAHLGVTNHVRRAFAKLAVASINVGAGRFGNV